MITISPSILACDFLNIESEVTLLNSVSDIWIHLDIMDGHFVPNLTFGPPVIKRLKDITSHKLDAHFMVTNPEIYADQCKNLGIHNFTFHWEAVTHHDRFIKFLKGYYPSIGVALNPSTSIESIPKYLFKDIDLILIMSVNPGFGGQSFIEGVMDKINYLKMIKQNFNPNLIIQVDGGVNDTNAKKLISAGVTNLVAGSYIFNEPKNDYKSRIDLLRS